MTAPAILLVEDDPPLRVLTARALQENGYEVRPAGSSPEMWIAFDAGPVDLVILDIMLPELDGMSILREIRRVRDKTPVLMISARDAVANRVEGLDAGADDYLVKPFDLLELVARVRALARRKFDQEVPEIQTGDLHIDCVRKLVTRRGRQIEVTRLEYKLINYLAHRAGQPVSRQEIAEHIYADSGDGGSNKIDVCVTYLRKKLNAPGEPDLIKTRRGFGYMLGGPEE